MVIENDRWRCTLCGEFVEGLDLHETPRAEFRGRSGERTQRVVTVGDREVHRCDGPHHARAAHSHGRD